MGIEDNPIYVLARRGEDEGLSEKELLAIASTPDFLRTVRTPDHYEDILELLSDDWVGNSGLSLIPPLLTTVALHCAYKKRVRGALLGTLLIMESVALFQNMRLEEALVISRRARSIFTRLGENELIHITKFMMSMISVFQGKHDVSPKRYRSVGKITMNEARDLGPMALIRMGSLLMYVGEYERAYEVFSVAKQAKTVEFQAPQRVTLNCSMVWCSLQTGKYENALDLLAETLKMSDVAQAPRLRFLCLYYLAMVYIRLGEFESAIGLLKEAKGFYRSISDEMMALQCGHLLVRAYEDSGHLALAAEVLGDSIREYQRSGHEAIAAECRVKLAGVYRKMGLYEKSLREKAIALEIFENRRHNLGLAECANVEAWVYAEMGQYEEAQRRFEALLKQFGHLDPLEAGLDYHLGMGCAYSKTGDLEKARTSYEQCIEIIEGARGSLRSPNRRSSFLESLHTGYEKMIACCLQQSDARAALEYVERLKSRSLVELLGTRDLVPRYASEEDIHYYKTLKSRFRTYEWRLSREQDPVRGILLSPDISEEGQEYDRLIARLRESDPNFDPDQTAHLSCDDIMDLVSDGATALIEFFPFKDSTVAFVIRRDGECREISAIMEDYDREALKADVKAFHDKTRMVEALRTLYDKLIEPLHSRLVGITKIIVIPYAGLHLLPFHAMFKEEDGLRTYLIDEYLISYAPSAKILKLTLNKPRSHNHDGRVAWANPRRDLPLARREAEAIAALQDWTIVPAVTREGIIDGGLTAGVIHYTGHADGNALILHNEGAGDGEDLYDTGDIFVGLDLPRASLVTLSACDTGRVGLGMTDEYIGLPSAFLHAGAATVICSLWSVSDTSTTLLMAKMYRLIKDGLGKAEALREAQLWLKNPNNRAEHLQELEKLLPWLRPAAGKPMPDAPRFGRTTSLSRKAPARGSFPPLLLGRFHLHGSPLTARLIGHVGKVDRDGPD